MFAYLLWSFIMQQKEEMDKFKKEYKSRPWVEEPRPAPSNHDNKCTPMEDDPQYKAFLEIERLKSDNKRKYAAELMQVAYGLFLLD